MTATEPLPTSVQKAFAAWPAIAGEIRKLFERAPGEAIADPETMLAGLALESVERFHYPTDLADGVRRRAQTVIAVHAKDNLSRIEQALDEPKELLEQLNQAIISLSAPREPFFLWDAKEKAQQFLDTCRHFDQSLSAIPAKLRGSLNAG